jgi:hypothetical protein
MSLIMLRMCIFIMDRAGRDAAERVDFVIITEWIGPRLRVYSLIGSILVAIATSAAGFFGAVLRSSGG